jgi:Uma2 family endonuclease
MTITLAHGTRLTWDEWDRLPEDTHCEYIDGRLVMSPAATGPHAYAVYALQRVLAAALGSGLLPITGFGWRIGDDEFSPDVMIVTRGQLAGQRLTEAPSLTVEVLSTNRRSDLYRKVARYARGRAPAYWILDLRDRTITAFRLVDGVYEVDDELDEEHPVGELFTGAGPVKICLTDLLA